LMRGRDNNRNHSETQDPSNEDGGPNHSRRNGSHERHRSILLHVAFKNAQQITQSSPAFFSIDRTSASLLEVPMHQRFGKRPKGAPGRNNLGQDYGAITVNIEHTFDRLNLTGNFAKPKL